MRPFVFDAELRRGTASLGTFPADDAGLNHHMANCRDLAMVTHSCFSLSGLKDLYEHGLLTEVPAKYYTPFSEKKSTC